MSAACLRGQAHSGSPIVLLQTSARKILKGLLLCEACGCSAGLAWEQEVVQKLSKLPEVWEGRGTGYL